MRIMVDLLSLTSKFSELSSRLRRNSDDIIRTTAQLSSGQRIQSAGQDVASLSIATRLRSGLAGIRTAANSLGQASSLLQIADGGLAQIGNMIDRINQLAIRGANAALSNTERNYLNIELMQLMDEVNHIAESTKFSGIHLLTAPEGKNLVGTSNPDTLIGGQGADCVTGYEGNDLIYLKGGDDVVKVDVQPIPGLKGSVYLSPGAIGGLATANAYVAGNAPNATFTASSIDYPNGPSNNGGATIGAFIGVDAPTLSNAAVATAPMNQAIFVFEGDLKVPADGTYSFNVGSDDGFDLQIDGVTVSQFPGNRGFAFTNLNINLTQGSHDFRLLYWENAGGHGVLVNSDMFASNIVDNTATEFVPPTDGDDTVYGGSGNDVVELSGTRLDYTITEEFNGAAIRVTDNRPDSPNGSDLLYDVERLRFSDGEELYIGKGGDVPNADVPTTLHFNVVSADGKTFQYDVVDATTRSLFDDPSDVGVGSIEQARRTITAAQEAMNRVTGMRAYVGSKQSQAGILESALRNRAVNTDDARAVIDDTNVAEVSTEYALLQAKQQAGINVAAQSDLLRFDLIKSIFEKGLST
jgi:flagellin-like hook-associated protein FlgL